VAVHSYGGSVLVDWAGGSTYVALAQVVSFKGPDLSRTKSPGWHLLSAGRFKSKVGGMIDADDIDMMLRYTKAQFAVLLTNVATDNAGIKLLFSDTSYMTLTGFLSKLGSPEHGDDDSVSQSASLCCNSLPVFVPAA
jgi:hypothetical protein